MGNSSHVARGWNSSLGGRLSKSAKQILYDALSLEGAGVYFATDFANTNFESLWGTAPASDGSPGRGDLAVIAQTLRGNALRMYNFYPGDTTSPKCPLWASAKRRDMPLAPGLQDCSAPAKELKDS